MTTTIAFLKLEGSANADLTITENVTFDAVLAEDINQSSTLTSNPIETGAEINDHIFLNPTTYTITAGVSNNPLFDFLSVPDISLPAFLGGETEQTRREAMWDRLTAIHEGARLFDVQTGLTKLFNMIITDLSTPNDPAISSSLIFTATITQVNLAPLVQFGELTKEQIQKGSPAKQASPNEDQGKVTKKEPLKSALAKIVDFFGEE